MTSFYIHLYYKMVSRLFSTLSRHSIAVSEAAWDKMEEIIKTNADSRFIFSASGGGCSGFNYDLRLINKEKFENMHTLYNNKFKLTIMRKNNTELVIDPVSEILLTGTTVDYMTEDYKNGIFESKVIFTPDTELASSCGCGISFTPKD